MLETLRACGYQPRAESLKVCLTWLRPSWVAGCTKAHLHSSRKGTKRVWPAVGRNRAPLSNVTNFTCSIHD